MAKQKIVILGGGVAALTSAFYLASRPGAAERYDITIYQHGWRLVGKCATGRNMDYANRVEEHGIHGRVGGRPTLAASPASIRWPPSWKHSIRSTV